MVGGWWLLTIIKKICAMQLTWLDSNYWVMEIAGKRILLDPWLVGSLVFANQSWFFQGEKPIKHPIPENIDLILLSQGLEDHAHSPTLKVLDRNIPVVGSPSAAKVCKSLGYVNVHSLEHGKSFVLDGQIEIKAVPGAPIGPTLVENGYILRNLNTPESLYYEPHGFHSPSLKEEEAIEIIITPIVSLNLPLIGPFIQGQKSALEVCKLLKPEFILPTTTGGNTEYQGLLSRFLSEEGTIEDFRSLLSQNNLDIKVIKPQPGEPIEIKHGEK
jgi:L-ascorbate metabolism protein UlaG (beta-lactamase superfamily)